MMVKKEKVMEKTENFENLINLQDHRRSDRFQPKVQYDVRLTRQSAPSLFRGINSCTIKDIGNDGIGLFSSKAILRDEPITIDIFFPACKLSVSGYVVHCREFQSGFVIGIKLHEPCRAIKNFVMAYEEDTL